MQLHVQATELPYPTSKDSNIGRVVSMFHGISFDTSRLISIVLKYLYNIAYHCSSLANMDIMASITVNDVFTIIASKIKN